MHTTDRGGIFETPKIKTKELGFDGYNHCSGPEDFQSGAAATASRITGWTAMST